MSNENTELKTQFGKLGMYLVDQAKEKIKELNQQILFRKAEIKKKYREKEVKNSKNLRNEFIVEYDHILNANFSTTILKTKEKILKFKNQIVSSFIKDLHQELVKKIKTNYSNYTAYIFENIVTLNKDLKNKKNTVFYFNSRDVSPFTEERKKIEQIVEEKVAIKEDPKIDIGGFKIELSEKKIAFNYTLKNIIQDNYSIIETKFASLIADSEIKDIQNKFEQYINEQKKKKEDILVEYDRI
ncbi:MAG: putative V-type proton ATPase subunit E [Promethearchaeota archaeon]|nr:MAG: putative V-type proton ATPase subunit E [Candidatus Lokiarchaeota archaeon]